MKIFAIVLACLAVSFIMAHGWVGPVYTMYDWCPCGQSRAWFEFNDSESLRHVKFFRRIVKQGDLQHQHQFTDAKYDRQYPILVYSGVGFGVLSAGCWFYSRRRAYDHVA